MIGRALGHHRVLDLLGAGGMGEVCRAEDTKLGRKVAIKVLPENIKAELQVAINWFTELAELAPTQSH